MAFKLIKSNPLYGKEGTLINNSLHKQLPDRHKELFIKADSNSKTNAHKQFEDGIREAMEQIQAVRAGREIQGNRPDLHQAHRVYFGGIPQGLEPNIEIVQFNLDEVEDEDDDDDHGWDLMEEDFEEDEDDEEDF